MRQTNLIVNALPPSLPPLLASPHYQIAYMVSIVPPLDHRCADNPYYELFANGQTTFEKGSIP